MRHPPPKECDPQVEKNCHRWSLGEKKPTSTSPLAKASILWLNTLLQCPFRTVLWKFYTDVLFTPRTVEISQIS